MHNKSGIKKKKEDLILDREAPILREKAAHVELAQITSKKVKDIITKMKKALHQEEDGVALAAPQIGVSLKIFIVKGSVLDLAEEKKSGISKTSQKDLVFVNPEIVKVSKNKRAVEEGCLSIRWLYGEVPRHEKVSITAYDDRGEFATYGATGLLAQIFQHEIDHLDGILFTDKAENIRDLPPDENVSSKD